MMQRKLAQEKVDQEKEQLELERVREEEEALQAMVEREMKRKEMDFKLKLKNQRHERLLSQINGSGDWTGERDDGSDSDQLSHHTTNMEASANPPLKDHPPATPKKNAEKAAPVPYNTRFSLSIGLHTARHQHPRKRDRCLCGPNQNSSLSLNTVKYIKVLR